MFGSYDELCLALKEGRALLEEIVKFYLKNIEKGKYLNAFLSVYNVLI